MDFWCHASALFALSWARACNSDLIKRRMLVCAAAAAVRTAGSAQRFHRAHRETPWQTASALASALSPGCCSYTACSSRLDESRCHSLPPLILPLALARSPSPHLPSATASPSSSPHPSRRLPHLHLHSCPRTRTLTLTSLHCARRCRLLWSAGHFACGGGRPSKLKDASRGGAQPPQHEQLTSRGGCSTPPARTIDF